MPSPTLHFGRDSHVCSPPTHAVPHAPNTHANGRVTQSFMGGLPSYAQKTAFLFQFLCLPCRPHNYREKKKTSKGKRPRENIFPRVGGWAGGHCFKKATRLFLRYIWKVKKKEIKKRLYSQGDSPDVCETLVFLFLILLVAKIGLPLISL